MTRRCPIHVFGRDTGVRYHWCAPGLSGPVRKYIRETYGVEPVETRRPRSLVLDGCGMVFLKDPWTRVQMDGWSIRVRKSDIHAVLSILRRRLERPRKVYSGVETVRVPALHGLVVMLESDVRRVIDELAPMSDASFMEAVANRQVLAASAPMLRIPGLPGIQGGVS